MGSRASAPTLLARPTHPPTHPFTPTHSPSLPPLRRSLFAASSVFVQSGMSACGCAVASLLSDWFRHAAPARALAPAAGARPRAAPAAAKLLMLPLLAFGPGVGVPAAVLM